MVEENGVTMLHLMARENSFYAAAKKMIIQTASIGEEVDRSQKVAIIVHSNALAENRVFLSPSLAFKSHLDQPLANLFQKVNHGVEPTLAPPNPLAQALHELVRRRCVES